MKIRIFALVLTLIMLFTCFAGCTPVPNDDTPACQHRDANDDGFCDLCQSVFSDGPEKKEETTTCRNHRDANDDFKCDYCKKYFTDGSDQAVVTCSHKDSNEDFKCDYCGNDYYDPSHICKDADDDMKCDSCKRDCDDGKDVFDECPHYNLSDTISEFKQSTCTEDGYNLRYWNCLDCGERVVGIDEHYPAKNHFGTVVGICNWCGELDPGGQLAEGELYKKVSHGGVNYLFFGEYPQMLKKNDVTITDTQDARGYYLGSDGYYYAKITANSDIDDGSRFLLGETIVAGKEYFFKVQPIRWRILSEENGVVRVVCDSILDYKPYQPEYVIRGFEYFVKDTDDCYANSYKYSYLRKWLNDTFYNYAFSSSQQNLILTTTVINREYDYDHESYQNTQDKIYILDAETIDEIRRHNNYSDTVVINAPDNSDYSYAKSGRKDAIWWSRITSTDGHGYWGSQVWAFDSVYVIRQSYYTDHEFGVLPEMYVNLSSN